MILEYSMRWTDGIFSKYDHKFIAWLFADAGDMTPKGAAIMLIVATVFITLLICYARRHPESKWEREWARSSMIAFILPFWLAREIIMFIVKKLRRKKR